jgi:hypothetical protein
LALSLAGAGLAHAAEPSNAPPLYRPSAQAPAAVAGWLARYTTIAFDQVVSIGDEYIVAVISSRPVDADHPAVLHLEIRAELTDPDSQAAKQMRSLTASLEMNCAGHSARFLEVHTFAGANLTGDEQTSHPTEGWVPNPRGSYFEDIESATCKPGSSRPLLPGKVVEAAATAPAAAAAPAPERAPPQLRPAFSADLPPPRAPAAPSPKPAPPPRPSEAARPGGSAQIAAGASQAKAEAALAELRAAQPALMRGLSTRVEPVERAGVTLYRALVFGFSPPADPASFCRRLSAAGRACIPR